MTKLSPVALAIGMVFLAACGGQSSNGGGSAAVTTHPARTYVYSGWGACQPDGTQTRSVTSFTPADCLGTPILSQSCTYVPAPAQLVVKNNYLNAINVWVALSSDPTWGPVQNSAPIAVGTTFTLGNIPPGTYDLRAASTTDGQSTTSLGVIFAAGQTRTWNICVVGTTGCSVNGAPSLVQGQGSPEPTNSLGGIIE